MEALMTFKKGEQMISLEIKDKFISFKQKDDQGNR